MYQETSSTEIIVLHLLYIVIIWNSDYVPNFDCTKKQIQQRSTVMPAHATAPLGSPKNEAIVPIKASLLRVFFLTRGRVVSESDRPSAQLVGPCRWRIVGRLATPLRATQRTAGHSVLRGKNYHLHEKQLLPGKLFDSLAFRLINNKVLIFCFVLYTEYIWTFMGSILY